MANERIGGNDGAASRRASATPRCRQPTLLPIHEPCDTSGHRFYLPIRSKGPPLASCSSTGHNELNTKLRNMQKKVARSKSCWLAGGWWMLAEWRTSAVKRPEHLSNQAN